LSVADTAACERAGGYVGQGNKCYSEDCDQGCIIRNGQVLRSNGTIVGASSGDCSLAQNEGNLCSVGGSSGYCYLDPDIGERRCKLFTDNGD
jgi:hypothetical protein